MPREITIYRERVGADIVFRVKRRGALVEVAGAWVTEQLMRGVARIVNGAGC